MVEVVAASAGALLLASDVAQRIISEMSAYGTLGDIEPVTDLLVRKTLSEQRENVKLRRRKAWHLGFGQFTAEAAAASGDLIYHRDHAVGG